MDGTLVDTEGAWSQAAGGLARTHGVPWSAVDDDRIVGWAVPRLADHLRSRGVQLSRAEVAERLHRAVRAQTATAMPWRPGARDLLAQVLATSIPVGLVTATYATGVGALLDAVKDLSARGGFDVVITGDVVAHQKPHPEPYLRAARQLGVEPGDCVVLEDSVTGVTAALEAGMQAWCVEPATALPRTVARHPRLHRVSGLTEVMGMLGLEQHRTGRPFPDGLPSTA
jgi:HAD superfamily hydrolase (TIGR01509 family)